MSVFSFSMPGPSTAARVAVLIDKGDEFLDKGMYREAILCFNKALKLEPNSDSAWNNKGVALEKMGRYEEALLCFERAYEINPSLELYRSNLKIELENLGRADEFKNYDKYVPKYVPGAPPYNRYNDPTLPGYNPNLRSNVNGLGNITSYCVQCKDKRKMKHVRQITMKNGGKALSGNCGICNTKMFKIGG